MHGNAFDLRVALREIFGEEDVGEFGLPVARPGVAVCHWPGDFGKGETAFDSKEMARGAEVDDADVGVGFFGGLAQSREEFGSQQGVSDVVGAELDLVAFFRCDGGHGHDAGVVYEDVEAGGGRRESIGGRLDGGKGGKVESEEADIGVGEFLFYGGDCGFGFGGGSGGEVDVGVVFGQLEDAFGAEAIIPWRAVK